MRDRFDLLVFDWDGTLFDSIGWIVESIQQAAQDCDLEKPTDQAARSVIGLSLNHAMCSLYPGLGADQTSRLAEAYRAYYHREDGQPPGLFAGIPPMLDELRAKGYRLAVATGKLRAGLDHALRETALEDAFDVTRCADEAASKPDPLMLHQIMSELGVRSERTVLIGDSVHDMRMANNAGVVAIAVGCGANSLSELEAFNPLFSMNATADLLTLLDSDR